MKFTKFEKWIIETAVKSHIEKAEKQVEEAQKQGINLIYAPGYFKMVGDELLGKLDKLTYKNRR